MIGNTEILKNVPVLYFISDGIGHIKIGITGDIKRRFNSMQVNNFAELKIIHLKYGGTIDEVHNWEHEYHSKLSEHKIRGEWFKEKPTLELLEGKESDCKTYLLENANFLEFMQEFLRQGDIYFAK